MRSYEPAQFCAGAWCSGPSPQSPTAKRKRKTTVSKRWGGVCLGINQSKIDLFFEVFCSSFSSTTPFSCHIESRSMWKVESVAANSQPRQQKQKETPKRLESAWKGKKAFVSSFCAPLFSLNEHNAQSVDDCLCHLLANPSGRKVGFGPGRSTDQLEKAWFLAGTAPGRGRFDCSKPDLSSQLKSQREQSDSSRLRQ